MVCSFRFIQPGSTQADLAHGACTVGWSIIAVGEWNSGFGMFIFLCREGTPYKPLKQMLTVALPVTEAVHWTMRKSMLGVISF